MPHQNEGEIYTYLFAGTVSALSRTTLVSNVINFPFRVKWITAYFPLNTNRLNRLYFYSSFDPEAPTTEIVDEADFFRTRGNVSYVTGNDERRIIHHEFRVLESGSYLKVHAQNLDGVDHTIDAAITIARLDPEDD